MAMRRFIDTLFMNNLARQWAEQDAQRKQMADATMYAADQSKRLFDERAKLTEDLGATAQMTGQPLSSVDLKHQAFAPHAQLGWERSQAEQEKTLAKNAFERALEEYKQQQQTERTNIGERGAMDRLGISEGAQMARHEAMLPIEQQKANAASLSARSRADLNDILGMKYAQEPGLEFFKALTDRMRVNKMGQGGAAGAGKLHPIAQQQTKLLEKAMQHAASMRSKTAGVFPVEADQAQRELVAAAEAWAATIRQYHPDEADEMIRNVAPVIDSMRGGISGQGGSSPTGGGTRRDSLRQKFGVNE